MNDVNLSSAVGQLVAETPGAARVFEQFGIDYCCGGKERLEQACVRRGIDAKAVVAALQAARSEGGGAEQTDWNTMALSELIAHIVATHHAYLRRELPHLAGLCDKVVQVHGVKHAELTRCEEVLGGLRAELEAHMTKEEQILFPMIQNMEAARAPVFAGCGSMANPIRVMEMEHDSAGEALASLRELTGGYHPPADACASYEALLAGLSRLEADLHQHIHKENNILFPRALRMEAEFGGVR
jgi:regulator of cell morphogenesis and NO signaling